MKRKFLINLIWGYWLLGMLWGQAGAWAAEPGYCLGCHLQGRQSTLAALSWQGPLETERVTLCPGVRRAKEELFFLEIQLARTEAWLAGAGEDSRLRQRWEIIVAGYRSGLGRNLDSIEAMEIRLKGLRQRLQTEVYRPIQKALQTRQRIIFFGVVLAGLLACLLAIRRSQRRWGGGERHKNLRGIEYWTAVFLLGIGAGVFLLLGITGQSNRPSMPEQAPFLDARQHLARLSERTRKVLALCSLAVKATAPFPDQARAIYGRASKVAYALQDPAAIRAASILRKLPVSEGRQKTLLLARRIEAAAHAAWPLRLVAEGLLPLDPRSAAEVLESGLNKARNNPHKPAGLREQAGLIAVLARWDAPRAREMAAKLSSPLWRSWLWRRIAEFSNQRQHLQRAVPAAVQITGPLQRALSLSACAASLCEFDYQAGHELFRRAWREARALNDGLARTRVQAEVAARLAMVDPKAGFVLAQKTESDQGESFKALSRAAAGMLAQGSRSGDGFITAARDEGLSLNLRYERNKALYLLARDLAATDWRLARNFLEQARGLGSFLQADAQRALVLARAHQNPKEAALLALAVKDRAMRLLVRIRLAAPALDPDKHKILFQRARRMAGQDKNPAPAFDLAPAWAKVDAGQAKELALAQNLPEWKVRTFLALARALAEKGQSVLAQGCIYQALQVIKDTSWQETLDKVRLLGDMGLEWSVANPRQGLEFFELAVRLCEGKQ